MKISTTYRNRETGETGRVTVRFVRLGDQPPPLTVRFGARLGQRSYSSVLDLNGVDDQRLMTFDL